MPIDGINTAMTPLQFSRARAASRAIEMTEASIRRSGLSARGEATLGAPAPAAPAQRGAVLIAPANAFHCTYRPIPGKAAAKRQPQVADSAYWSFAVNRLG